MFLFGKKKKKDEPIEDEELEITEAVGDWARVRYNGKNGWSSIDYLKLKGGIKYTVTYSADGASSLPPSSTKEHGVSISVSGIIPEKAGHEFLGWSSRAGDIYIYSNTKRDSYNNKYIYNNCY